MENVISPDHVDDLPIVETNQPDVVPFIPERVLVDKDEDPKEKEFQEKEEPKKEKEDTKVDIKEDENKQELTYPYEEVDPFNPSPPASDSEPKDVIEIEDTVESEDVTVPVSVHKPGNAEERDECKKLKKELKGARFSNTLLRMQNGRVKRDLCWTRVQAREFYQEMIRKGFMFEERPNEAIDV
nr:hypothetical protein [Tanacetum cinerariifolium]